ncbi:MAG: phosphatidylserine decarboxylase family protein [Desulfobacterales bacterium]
MGHFFRADPQSRSAFPIAEPGYPLIAAAGFATLIFALVDIVSLALPALAVTFFICWFFRDPDRITPDTQGALVSAADGKVVCVRVTDSNPYVAGRCLQIGVFMNLFSVHVNRIPCSGQVREISYTPGRFYPADRETAFSHNERNAVILESESGYTVGVLQIAGLVARRIICNTGENQEVKTGQRFGMICFGSRVDLFLPENSRPAVAVGDKVRAGASIVGYLPDAATPSGYQQD